ncbi:MAG: class I SAM-dependent methyltransferase [Armatimonadota bacterium]|nr:class I SAM-dependent methyltransferase [Armatimonadota bacterium]
MHDSQAHWDVAAERYRTSSWHSNEAALSHLVDAVVPINGRVLDVATGAGHAALALAPHAEAVTATDTSPRMLEVAQAEALRRGLSNVAVELADAQNLPFENGAFELVVCRTAAHHFHEPLKFLGEAHRVLAPSGRLLLIDTTGSDDEVADDLIDTFERLRDPSHVRNYTKAAWRNMAERCNFTVEFEETVSKPLNAKEWLERSSTPEDARTELLEMIAYSHGWFREYLSPHGEGDLLTFHLDETSFVLRK